MQANNIEVSRKIAGESPESLYSIVINIVHVAPRAMTLVSLIYIFNLQFDLCLALVTQQNGI